MPQQEQHKYIVHVHVYVGIQCVLTFAVAHYSQFLKVSAARNPPSKAGIPFRRNGQVQLTYGGH